MLSVNCKLLNFVSILIEFVITMTSNDSGVESSNDNDDCAQPIFQNKRLVSSAVDMSLVPTRRRYQEFPPVSLCLSSMFARPSLDNMPSRKFKCLFELANPSYPVTLDRFQSVSLFVEQNVIYRLFLY